MMNYLAGLLGIALLGAITTSAIYRSDAADYKSQLVTLKASYAATAQAAKDDAQKQIAADKAENQRRADSSIAQAEAGKKQAQDALSVYLQKGNAASKGKVDMSHACFSVQVPSELLPGAK